MITPAGKECKFFYGDHRLEAPAYPAQRPGQLDIQAQPVGRHLTACGLLGGNDDLFDLLQRAREASGKAIGQQAEGTVTLGAVPTRNPGPGWIDPLIGAVARKRTTACRMQRAAFQSCILPGLVLNVLFAGEACCQA